MPRPQLIPWDGVYDDEQPPMLTMSIYMNNEMRDQVQQWACQHHCSLSEAIRTFITWGLNRNAQRT